MVMGFVRTRVCGLALCKFVCGEIHVQSVGISVLCVGLIVFVMYLMFWIWVLNWDGVGGFL